MRLIYIKIRPILTDKNQYMKLAQLVLNSQNN